MGYLWSKHLYEVSANSQLPDRSSLFYTLANQLSWQFKSSIEIWTYQLIKKHDDDFPLNASVGLLECQNCSQSYLMHHSCRNHVIVTWVAWPLLNCLIVNKIYLKRTKKKIHISTNVAQILSLVSQLTLLPVAFTRQVRERLRVALERVSMLEDQLAASSQEVKSNASGFLCL